MPCLFKDLNDFSIMNKAYEILNLTNQRVALEISKLPKDVLVEIDCIVF